MMHEYRVATRGECRNCGSKQLVRFLSLPALPLTDALLRTPDEALFTHPIGVFVCRECGLAQTQHDLHGEDVYRDYKYTAFASGFAQAFMRDLAGSIWDRWQLSPGDRVIEIGSGDGTQLRYFKDLGATVLGFEPSEPLCAASREQGVPVLTQLFNADAVRAVPEDVLPAQVVLLTYTFDHLPDPRQFLSYVQPILDAERGLLVIEVHDFAKIFERREFCLFEHEHSVYPTAATLQRMLADAGFELIALDVLPENRRRANSLLAVATPRGSRFAATALAELPLGQQADVDACLAFGQSVDNSLRNLSAMLMDRRARGIRVAGYGAGGRGVMTMAATARPGDIQYVCDKNPAFHGYYTPCSQVPVVSPAYAIEHPVDEMIVFSFGYFSEIYDDMKEFRDKGGRLINLLDVL